MNAAASDILAAMERLHLGCGGVRFEGWTNIDLDAPGADLHWDLNQPLPFADGSVRYIYHEHMLEHLDLASGMRLLKDCRRLLRPGGVMRVAMPDLDNLIDKYCTDWRDQDWVNWPGFEYIKTRAQMLNIAMREWGHQYLYNREELELRLQQCGFTEIEFPRLGQSRHGELQNRETRKDSILVAEAGYS